MKTKPSKKQIMNCIKTLQKADENIVIVLNEYDEKAGREIPNYYYSGKMAKQIDREAEEAEKEYIEGKCKTLNSLSDLD